MESKTIDRELSLSSGVAGSCFPLRPFIIQHHYMGIERWQFMGMITTAGKYCYVQCDRRNCNKKMEHIDRNLLRDLAKLCGWRKRGDQWTCPECSERAETRKRTLLRETPIGSELEA